MAPPMDTAEEPTSGAVPTSIDEEIGARIMKARQAKGLTLRQVASQLGVAHGTVGNWETGRRPMRLIDLYRVAEALGRSPASFLVETEEAISVVEYVTRDQQAAIQVVHVLASLDEGPPEPPDEEHEGG